MEIERITCHPKQIVDDVASLMQVRADEKKLPLRVQYASPIPETVHTDPTRLRQILINLLGNAIKFTSEGEVRLVIRLLREPDSDALLQFEVIDSGIGMTPEQMARLFRPFTQADTSTTRRFGGTGLGLTISKRLTEMLGGTIQVQSAPNEGSRFTVTIGVGPLDGVRLIDVRSEGDDEAGETASRRRQAKTKAQEAAGVRLGCNVLLAEDGPDNQRLISFVLKKAGARVTVVGNGQEAIDAVLAAEQRQDESGAAGQNDRPFDVILMDMQMPVLDGYSATRRLREAGYDGPVIALTAHAMSHDRQRCLDAGCDDYTTKPIKRPELLEIVARYAERQGRGTAGTGQDEVRELTDARD